MSDFLQTMANHSAARAAAVSTSFSSADFDKPVVPLTLGRFDIIAEIKDRSPAEGKLTPTKRYGDSHRISRRNNSYGDSHRISRNSYGDCHRISRARDYASGGVAAISVLTEPSRFDGDLAHLEAVVAAVPGTPVMRKDFLVEPVQILEARKAGASGVLLIATMLSHGKLREMLDRAWEYDLFVLLESFDENDLLRAAALLDNDVESDKATTGQLLFGVNTRDLRTLQVDQDRLENLAASLPHARCVAESGLLTPADAARVAGWGYSIALVGSALMRCDDPAALVKAMQRAGAAA